MKSRDQEAWGLSADDSIEIEFPSLKQSAPQLIERVESKRAPGPIEAQLSGSAGDDDLSWLSAIFADDEGEDDNNNSNNNADIASQAGVAVEVDPKTEAGAGPADPVGSTGPDTPSDDWPDLTTAEPPIVLEGLLDDLLDDQPPDRSAGATEGSEADLLEVVEDDLVAPPVPFIEDETYDDTADETDAAAGVDAAPDGADGDPRATGIDHTDAPSRSKKATGFREEIMSTFSQMYN